MNEGGSMINVRMDPMMPAIDSVVDRLSRAYAERVERMNEMRERLDRIGEILLPYMKDAQALADLEVQDLEHILKLTQHGGVTGTDAG